MNEIMSLSDVAVNVGVFSPVANMCCGRFSGSLAATAHPIKVGMVLQKTSDVDAVIIGDSEDDGHGHKEPS